jgi:hypothetical protein
MLLPSLSELLHTVTFCFTLYAVLVVPSSVDTEMVQQTLSKTFVYCKQVYATHSDLYLDHHQVNSIKHKLNYLNIVFPNMDPYYENFVVVIISEYALKKCKH